MTPVLVFDLIPLAISFQMFKVSASKHRVVNSDGSRPKSSGLVMMILALSGFLSANAMAPERTITGGQTVK